MAPEEIERLTRVEEKCHNLELFQIEVKADIKEVKEEIRNGFAEVNQKLTALPLPANDWKKLVIFGLAVGAGLGGGGTGIWKIAEVLAKGL